MTRSLEYGGFVIGGADGDLAVKEIKNGFADSVRLRKKLSFQVPS